MGRDERSRQARRPKRHDDLASRQATLQVLGVADEAFGPLRARANDGILADWTCHHRPHLTPLREIARRVHPGELCAPARARRRAITNIPIGEWACGLEHTDFAAAEARNVVRAFDAYETAKIKTPQLGRSRNDGFVADQ
jgi:hypothetical protein